MKRKIAEIYGVNSYGQEFYMKAKIQNYSSLKSRESVFVEYPIATRNGTPKSFTVCLSANLDLNDPRPHLFWKEIRFEDGTVLNNWYSGWIDEKTESLKWEKENRYGNKFDKELNKFVGKPVRCKNEFNHSKCDGVLIAVEPRKDGTAFAYVYKDYESIYQLPVNKNTKIVAYESLGKEPKAVELGQEL